MHRSQHLSRRVYVPSVVLLIGLLGCGGGGGGASGTQPAAFSAATSPRLPAAVGSAESSADLAAGNTAFALDLYRQRSVVSAPNSLISPYGVSLLLAKVHLGAGTTTAEEVAGVCRFPAPAEGLHPAWNTLDQDLRTRLGVGAGGEMHTRSYGQARYGYLRSYLAGLDGYYGGERRELDFADANAEARAAVNDDLEAFFTGDWVERPSVAVSGVDTRLVFTDAATAAFAWAEPFVVEQTEEGRFYLSADRHALMPLMQLQSDLPHYDGDGFRAVELATDGSDLALLLVLPEFGRFDEVEARLDGALLQLVDAGLTRQATTLSLPRFTVTLNANLTSTLQALGLQQTTGAGQADLSEIDGSLDLYLTELGQGGTLAVDEAGGRTRSQTYAGIDDVDPETWTDPEGGGSSSYSASLSMDNWDVINVIANPWNDIFFCWTELVCTRWSADAGPFLYLLRDTGSGSVLAMGRVTDPDPDAETAPVEECVCPVYDP